MTGTRRSAVVVGGGCSGLTAALTLANAGVAVTVVERTPIAGGHAVPREFAPGFLSTPAVFDSGWCAPAFAALRDSGVKALPLLTPPGTDFTVLTDGGAGRAMSVPANPVHAADVLRSLSPADAARYPDFRETLQFHAGFLARLAVRPPPDIFRVTLRDGLHLLALGAKARRRGRRAPAEFLRTLPLPIHDLVEDWFEAPMLRAAIAAGGVQFGAHGPRASSTTLALLQSILFDDERGRAITTASDGLQPMRRADTGRIGIRTRPWLAATPDALIQALLHELRRRQVRIITDDAVSQILVEGSAAAGVILESGDAVRSEHVVATTDPLHTLHGLIAPEWIDPETRHEVGRIRMRGCTAYISYALDSLPPTLERCANVGSLDALLILTGDIDHLERCADALKYGELAEEPHVELLVATARWPSLAPAGKHVAVARVHYVPGGTPPGVLAARTEAVLERAFPGFLARTLHVDVSTPVTLRERFSTSEGTLHHGEVTLDQMFFMRGTPAFAHYRGPLPGVYLGGKGWHPGPGVAGGGGRLAAQALLHDLKG